MKAAAQTPKVADIVRFLASRLPEYSRWSLERLFEAVVWHVRIGGVHVVSVGDRIVAVALGRPVRRICDVNRRWAFNPRGRYLAVDAAAVDVDGVMAQVWREAACRWGEPEKVIFKRRKQCKPKIRVYPFALLNRRICHG